MKTRVELYETNGGHLYMTDGDIVITGIEQVEGGKACEDMNSFEDWAYHNVGDDQRIDADDHEIDDTDTLIAICDCDGFEFYVDKMGIAGARYCGITGTLPRESRVKGGSARSSEKSAAARENGKKGGRPIYARIAVEASRGEAMTPDELAWVEDYLYSRRSQIKSTDEADAALGEALKAAKDHFGWHDALIDRYYAVCWRYDGTIDEGEEE